MKNKRLINKISIAMLSIISSLMLFGTNVFADSIFGNAPDGVDTTKMTEMITLAFWVVRIIIAVSGLIPGFLKLQQGFTDEDDRKKNAGIVIIVITAVVLYPVIN